MTPARLAILVVVVAALALQGIASTASAQQAPGPSQQPAAPAGPTPPGQPTQPGTPAQPGQPTEPGLEPRPTPEEEEEPEPAPAEIPGGQGPPSVPEELLPRESFGFRVPILTIGDANLFLPPPPRGRLQITPSVTLSGEWNDNINRSPSGGRSDYILGITPGFTLSAQQPQYRVLAGYDTSASFFLRDTEDHEIGQRHRLFADVFYQHSPRVSFRLTERFLFDRDSDLVTVSGISTGRRDSYRNTLTPTVRWQATQLTGLELTASHSLLRFDEDEGVPDGRDSDTYRVRVGADHRFTPRLSGLADLGFGYFDIEGEPEAFTYTPRVGLSYQFTPRLQGYAAGGAAVLQRDGDFSASPAFGAGLGHLYRWGTVQVGYDRAIASEGIGLTDRQTILAAVRVLTLMRGLSLELLTRYTMADVEREGTDDDRDALSVNLRVVYRITQSISAIGSYTYYQQFSDRSDREFDQNRVFLGVQYAYPISFD